MIDTLTSVEDTAVQSLKQAQDAVLGVAKTVVDTVSPYVVDAPVSYPSQLPHPSAVVDNLFGFAAELLATNRTFTAKLLDTLAPLAVIKPEAKPAPVSKAKTAA